MKSPSLLFVLSSFILLSSCSPVIYYLGDSYEPTSAVEIYYDASEVKKPYKTIGRMTKEVSLSGDVEKKYMVREAKKRGADAIIFSDLNMTAERRQSQQVSVKAELIKFL